MTLVISPWSEMVRLGRARICYATDLVPVRPSGGMQLVKGAGSCHLAHQWCTLLPAVTGGTGAFFRYRPGLLGNLREKGETGKQRTGGTSYLRPGLVSVSDALVLGVLTLVCRISVKSRKQKEVSARNSDAGFRVLLHH